MGQFGLLLRFDTVVISPICLAYQRSGGIWSVEMFLTIAFGADAVGGFQRFIAPFVLPLPI